MFFNIKTEDEAVAAFAEFEKLVPFLKWYYEILSDDDCYIDIDDLVLALRKV